MTILKLYLIIFALGLQPGVAASVARPEWNYQPGERVSQLAPFPDSEHAEGILLTGNSGRIRLIAPGGRVLSSMQMDLSPTTNAIPVTFHRGEEPRIVAADTDGSIYCFRRSGERLWKYLRQGKAEDFKLLTVADLDGQGANDVLLSDSRGHLYAVDSNGHLRFEVTATNYRVSAAAAADIDGDGRAELVFSTEDNDVYAVRASGEVLWHAVVEGSLGRGLPIITTLDSAKSVVLVSTPYEGRFQGISALDAATGKPLWVTHSLLQVYQATAVADIDGEGIPEVLYGDKSTHVFCADAHGHPRWNVLLDGRGIFFAPAIVDLEGKRRATLFQVVRATGVNGKSLYAIQADGTVVDSWELPGGGVSSPILCRWRTENDVHLLVASGSGKVIAYKLEQNPGAKILWTGLQGRFAGPPPSPSRASSRPAMATASAAHIIPVSLGTTTISAQPEGAKLVAFRVADPDGTIHLTLIKPESPQAVTGELVASSAGNYELTTQFFGSDSKPPRTEHAIYRASAELNQPALHAPGELAAYLEARIAEARQLALTSGKVEDYDAAHAEANYALALMSAAEGSPARDPIRIEVVRNPWTQHNPTTLVKEPGHSPSGIQVRMLGNEYASVAVALTNLSARALTLELRTTVPSAVQFRAVPMVVPETTGKPQEDPLPLLGRDQTIQLAPAETRELWLTLHSRALDPGSHKISVQIFILERIAPPIEIPLQMNVSRVRLPDRFSYKHCNWLYLASINDEHILDATIRDAVEHRTNVFNIPGAAVSMSCDGSAQGADTVAADKLIRRLPGAFFMVGGTIGVKWPSGCSPDPTTQDHAYSQALHWYANHMSELGLSYADYALYPQDEPGLVGAGPGFDHYVETVKRIKAADPQMQVYANPTGGATPALLAPLMGLVDVWCPGLHDFRMHPEYTGLFSKVNQFWHYEAPADQRGLDPLGFYRVKPWIAFQLGMNGGGYWVYSSKDYWIPSHESEYGVVYPGPQGPVTTKRWEASREGCQDYELLLMLRSAAKASSSPDAKAALALIDEAVAFVTRGQENATDISRHFHTYAPDFQTWMDYRAKLISAAEELIP
jgi:outer membrane protein assembly factor BamB